MSLEISVIIPTCHRDDMLAKCLDCLALGVQTLPTDQYEVIVTDDGTRSTAEKMVRAHYPWARWMAGPKRGPAANRNNGASFAEGKWLAFTDDDCLPAREWLNGYSASITKSVLAYEGKITSDAGTFSPMMEAPINLTGGLFNSCNIMVEKTLFHHMGGFDEKFPHPAMEDWDFHDRILTAGLAVSFVDSAVVNHPPRRCHWGKQYAKLLESHSYLWYKQGQTRSFSTSVLIHIMLGRIRRLSKFPTSRDTLIALASWFAEMCYLVPRVRGWEKKYGNYFSPPRMNTQ